MREKIGRNGKEMKVYNVVSRKHTVFALSAGNRFGEFNLEQEKFMLGNLNKFLRQFYQANCLHWPCHAA